jgi:hypothetical protein
MEFHGRSPAAWPELLADSSGYSLVTETTAEIAGSHRKQIANTQQVRSGRPAKAAI